MPVKTFPIVQKGYRKKFELWISSPPLEKSIARNEKENSAWPGQYKNYEVQLAWEAFLLGVNFRKKEAANDGHERRD